MDRACFPKDNFYYFRAWWTNDVVLHLLPHWNWEGREGQEIRIWCHSNCDELELLLNGKGLGRKEMVRNSHLEWSVPYDPGVLEARGYNDGELVATKKVETTREPAAIRVRPERAALDADYQDVSAVTVEVIDEQGRVVPTADREITFGLTGSGRIIGVCNGDPACKITEDQTTYPVFNGLLMLYVQAGREAGSLTVEAASEGLTGATAIIEVVECAPAPLVPSCPGPLAGVDRP